MEHFFSCGFNPYLRGFFIVVIIILSNHPGVRKDFKRKLPLRILLSIYMRIYVTNMHA